MNVWPSQPLAARKGLRMALYCPPGALALTIDALRPTVTTSSLTSSKCQTLAVSELVTRV